MQVSMLALPYPAPPPSIGDTVAAEVRFTTTSFDDVSIS
jgi:hypothetical protein